MVRSKCTTCNQVAKSSPQRAQFFSLHIEIGTETPLISSEVHGYLTLAHLDTCAKTSIANRELYLHILDTKHAFEDILLTIKLADGSQSTKMVKKTASTITLGGRTLPIQFIVIPMQSQTRRLLVQTLSNKQASSGPKR